MRTSTILLLMVLSLNSFSQKFYLFVGTYTGNGSKGIYVYNFDASTGKTTFLNSTDSATNPSYLALSPNMQYVYAVNETAGERGGDVSAYAFDKKSASLKFINKQSTGGDHPCYVSIPGNNNWLAVANYSGGSAAIFPLEDDGSIKPFAQLLQDTGKSITKGRQDKPHVHSAVFSPDNKYLFTPDLGTDRVMIYTFDASQTTPLKPASPAFTASHSGDGPRHFVFHPNGKFAYLISELTGTVYAYRYDDGKLSEIQTILAHPASYKGTVGSADIHISPDGKFLYCSNRGDENTITGFLIDNNSGKLSLAGIDSTLGKTPRNFMIDPTGNYLLVANQESDNIVIFKRDKITGALKATGDQIKLSKPVCLKMAQMD